MTKLSEAAKTQNTRAGASLTALYTLQSAGISWGLSCVATIVTLLIQKMNNVTGYPQGTLGYITYGFILFRMDFLGIALFWGLCTGITWTCYKRYRQKDVLGKILHYALSLIGIVSGGLFLPYALVDLRAAETSSFLVGGEIILSIGLFLSLGTIIRIIIIRLRKEPRWEFPLSV